MAFDGRSEEKNYGHWKSIGSESSTHCMEYDHNTNYPPVWKKEDLRGLIHNIENRILKEVCGANYVIEKHNLLINLGEIKFVQILHTDYQPRQTK